MAALTLAKEQPVARAERDSITLRRVPLSQLFADPSLRTAFRRAEDDGLECSIAFAIPPDLPKTLAGGTAAELECEEVA